MKPTLPFDGKTEKFPGDAEANPLLTREYRDPYRVPERVGARYGPLESCCGGSW